MSFNKQAVPQPKQQEQQQRSTLFSPPTQPTDDVKTSPSSISLSTLTPPHNCQPPQLELFQNVTAIDENPKELPPRKRIQSLKKQFTKPNLSVPVIPTSPSIPANTSTTIITQTPIVDTATYTPVIDTETGTDAKANRSTSPFVDIEQDSGETTETEDDDLQHRRRAPPDATDVSILSHKTKRALIIPSHSEATKSISKAKKPLKKHWTKSSQEPPRLEQSPRSLLFHSQTQQQEEEEQHRQDTSSNRTSLILADEKKIKKKKKGRPPLNVHNKDEPRKLSYQQRKHGRRLSRAVQKKSLYCSCQTPYDASKFMIACDRCDQWFHGECIGISEKDGEFIDLYFCDVCVKETGKSTSWKSKCSNPACERASRISSHQGHLSKYCSHNCGMQVARARLELNEMKRRLVVTSDGGLNIPQLTIQQQRQSRLSSFAEKEDQHRLEQVQHRKHEAQAMVAFIDQKQCFFDIIKENPANGDVCGFDSRLVWEEQLGDEAIIVQKFLDKPYSSCQLSRRECQRHQHWQTIIGMELNQERNEQLQLLKNLEKEKQQIKTRMRKRRDELDLIDTLVNHTIRYS